MENMRDKIAIVGIGESDYVWKAERGVKAITVDAVLKALDDAKISPKDVDGIVSESYFTPPILEHYELAYNIGAQLGLSIAGPKSGAGNVALPAIAAMAITSGQADVVVAYLSSNFGSMGRSAYTYTDKANNIRASFETPYGLWGAPVTWPLRARRYMHDYGITSKQLGAVAVNQRHNAVLNGKGLFSHKPITMEDYDNSPMISDPLRMLDCTPMHDGACAWVMTSAERAKDCPHIPIYVMGSGYGVYPRMEADTDTQGSYMHKASEGMALDAALKMAGITRKDLDFAEIYDAFTAMLLTFFDSLGFCGIGEGGAFAESGITSLTGSLPVNTNGGHLSHSYLFGASHMVEAVRQLRGDAGACQVRDAKIGLVVGGSGGLQGSATILRKD